MAKKIECMDDGAEYNMKACEQSKQSSKKSIEIECDYSIPGKKVKPGTKAN